jgi:hypothetical protein
VFNVQFLVGLIIAPCGLLWAGAVIHLFYEPLEDVRAMFSCYILLFLLSTYTFATTASLLLHDWMVVPRLRQADEVEVTWRTHDMMFFTVSWRQRWTTNRFASDCEQARGPCQLQPFPLRRPCVLA